MITLNLETKNKSDEIIKHYLEENVSATLADKINNGTPIEKDGKVLINKKTLEQFMDYASSEAAKFVDKGAKSACIQDNIVFGWAIHYFEEESIEGTLYNSDGTPYKPKPTPSKLTPPTPKKPKIQPQMSLFDLMQDEKSTQKQEYVCEKSEPTQEIQDDVNMETGEILSPPSKPTEEVQPEQELEEEPNQEDEEEPNEESEQDEFDTSAYDVETLAKLDKLFGNEIILR